MKRTYVQPLCEEVKLNLENDIALNIGMNSGGDSAINPEDLQARGRGEDGFMWDSWEDWEEEE